MRTGVREVACAVSIDVVDRAQVAPLPLPSRRHERRGNLDEKGTKELRLEVVSETCAHGEAKQTESP